MAMKSSKEKLAVVTGCTRGLGRAMVKEFHELGWTTAGCGRSQEMIDEMRELFPERSLFSAIDVTDDSAVAEFADSVTNQFGAPDLLLNNAGVINQNAPLWEVPAEEFSQVIDVNIGGVANIIRQFTPSMIEAGRGVIVNFSSGWGRSTAPEVAPYCATKYAIEGLTEALSQELPRGVAAVALNPGVIDTEMLQSCFGEAAHSYPNADEWAKTAVPFLATLGSKDNGKALTAP